MDDHTIINIGRQYGSGGKAIAGEISRRLGIPLYDNELLTKAAEQSGFSPELFRKSDEKRRLWILGNSSGLHDGELFRIQSEVIASLSDAGSAIFIGRASNYVLRERRCLDVFICAPMQERIRRVCSREAVSPEEAEEYIFRKDRARAEYYNFFTQGHWGKSSDYNLCIDSSLLGIEGTAGLIIDFGRKAGLIK